MVAPCLLQSGVDSANHGAIAKLLHFTFHGGLLIAEAFWSQAREWGAPRTVKHQRSLTKPALVGTILLRDQNVARKGDAGQDAELPSDAPARMAAYSSRSERIAPSLRTPRV